MDRRNGTTNGIDQLTGLLNRQGLTRRARELLWLESLQHGVLACLVLRVQVDAGHVGSIAEECAASLKRGLRLTDVAARLGPTDFAILAPDTDARGAQTLATRLSTAIGGRFAQADEQNRVRIVVGYEVVSNLARAPIGAEALLLRATTAVRVGRVEGENRWIRRFSDAARLPARQEQLASA